MNTLKLFLRYPEIHLSRKLQHTQLSVIIQRKCSTNAKLNENSQDEIKENAKLKEETDYEDKIKNTILKASLPFVVQHGWTIESIEKGATSIGYPGVIHGLFPNKGAALVNYFYSDCNKRLVEIIKKDDTKFTDPFKFVQGAIETRLRMIIPYVKTWPQAMSIMVYPSNITHSLANILTLADDICYYSGDRSVDFDWYGRRIGVATMYKATELYLVQDESQDYVMTWRFLARNLEEFKQIQKDFAGKDKIAGLSKDVLSSTFITARNILGLNWRIY